MRYATFILTLLLTTFALSAASTDYPASMASGTIPIMYINTQNELPIEDKVNYITAEMYITVPKGSKYTATATAESPVALKIRGRGNVSWYGSPKKSYKIKLDKKASLLGIPSGKHFALLCEIGTSQYMARAMSFELSRQLEMAWTPRLEPIDLVLNGEYLGFYYLCETVRIHENRLDIYEQPDLSEDPDEFDGGWLIEIDNYDDDNQVVMQETADQIIRFTVHSPGEMSDMQYDYIAEELQALNDAIYSGDPTGEAWAEKISANSAAKYFLNRELLYDADGYNGSFYFHKDLGEKWTFGPLWDPRLGGTMPGWIMDTRTNEKMIIHWIEPMFHTDAFRQALIEEWAAIKPRLQNVYDYGLQLINQVQYADTTNAQRWPDLYYANPMYKYQYVHGCIRNNAAWIDNWVENAAGLFDVKTPASELTKVTWFTLQGQQIEFENLRRGQIYIRQNADGSSEKMLR